MIHNEIFDYSNFKIDKKEYAEMSFGVIGLAHGHIYGMCNGLIAAGAKLKYVYEADLKLLECFKKIYPQVTVCHSEEEVYQKQDIQLVASAAIPFERARIAINSMKSGKDFFVDKAPLITLDQLNEVKEVISKTKRKYFVYYGESIDNESTVFAYDLIKRGVIGKVIHVTGLAPHVLNYSSRPGWFFERNKSGGILIDIGSHQVHQFLNFANCENAKVDYARVFNYRYKGNKEFDESGEMLLLSENGVTGNFRLDWDSPSGLNTWGDPRTIIEGDKGYIELRKNTNIGFGCCTDNVFVVTDDGVFYECVSGKVGISFFKDMLHDMTCRNDSIISNNIAFNAIEIAIKAQNLAMHRED